MTTSSGNVEGKNNNKTELEKRNNTQIASSSTTTATATATTSTTTSTTATLSKSFPSNEVDVDDKKPLLRDAQSSDVVTTPDDDGKVGFGSDKLFEKSRTSPSSTSTSSSSKGEKKKKRMKEKMESLVIEDVEEQEEEEEKSKKQQQQQQQHKRNSKCKLTHLRNRKVGDSSNVSPPSSDVEEIKMSLSTNKGGGRGGGGGGGGSDRDGATKTDINKTASKGTHINSSEKQKTKSKKTKTKPDVKLKRGEGGVVSDNTINSSFDVSANDDCRETTFSSISKPGEKSPSNHVENKIGMIDNNNKNKNVKNDNDDTDKYESVGKGSNPGSKSKNDLKIVDLEESGGNVEISSEGEQTDIRGAGGGQGMINICFFPIATEFSLPLYIYCICYSSKKILV